VDLVDSSPFRIDFKSKICLDFDPGHVLILDKNFGKKSKVAFFKKKIGGQNYTRQNRLFRLFCSTFHVNLMKLQNLHQQDPKYCERLDCCNLEGLSILLAV
jgi:hypothetical protein